MKNLFDIVYAFNVVPSGTEGFQAVPATQTQPGQHCILRMKAEAPRFSLLAGWEVEPDDVVLQKLASPDYPLFSKAFISPDTADGLPESKGQGTCGTITVKHYRPGVFRPAGVHGTAGDSPGCGEISSGMEGSDRRKARAVATVRLSFPGRCHYARPARSDLALFRADRPLADASGGLCPVCSCGGTADRWAEEAATCPSLNDEFATSSETKPRLSVVIPTLGRPLLIRTLESLIRASGFDRIEVIVSGRISEGSVLDEVKKFCAQHAQIRHLPVSFPIGDSSEKKNAGIAREPRRTGGVPRRRCGGRAGLAGKSHRVLLDDRKSGW